MKIKNGFSLLKINGGAAICFNDTPLEQPVTINKIGVFLWEVLKNDDISSNELLNLLLEKFEISTVLALGEIDTFIKTMKINGIFEE